MPATLRQLIADATRHFRQSDAHASTRAILRAAVTVGGLTALIRLVAVANELVVAATFGTSEGMDAYNLSIVVPSFVISLIAGTFASVLVPAYVRVGATEGAAAARRYLSNVLVVGGGLLAVGSLLAGVTFPLVFLPHPWDPSQLAFRLMLLSLPLIVIRGLSLIFACVLNATQRFALASVAPVFLPAATLALVLLWGRELSVYALACGSLLGSVLELAVVVAAARRSGLFAPPRWYGVDAALRRTWASYLPLLLGAALFTAMWVATYRMIEGLGPGNVSAFTYGNKLVTLVLDLGSLALGTAVLPSFSRLAASEQWDSVRRTLRALAGTVLLATVPVSLALAVSSRVVVRIVFQRGQFSAEDTQVVGSIQAVAALQIPAYLLLIMAWRLVAALNRNWLNVEVTILTAVVHLGGSFVLMRRFGVVGIALSASLMNYVSLVYLFFRLRRLVAGRPRPDGDCKAREQEGQRRCHAP